MNAELPPLYQRWMGELLPGPIAREEKATCAECALCAPPGTPETPEYFSRNIKCCTSVPALPNFLCGRILGDRSAGAQRGRESLLQRLRRGAGVTPLGMATPPARELLRLGSKIEAQGRALALRCPHYLEDSGGCGIWSHREANCTTWFCRHVRGQVGLDFWNELHQLLRTLEIGLAQHLVLELDLGDEALALLSPVPPGLGRPAPRLALDAFELDGGVDPALYAARWGRWAGREIELYESCAERVESLGAAEVLALVGVEAAWRKERVLRAYRRARSDELPPRVRVGAFTLLHERAHEVTLQTFSVLDPLTVRRELYAQLHRFDGRELQEALEEIKSEGVEMNLAEVRELLDYGVLREG
jgi:hypothetical protein